MNKLNAALLALSFTALSSVIGCSAPTGDASEVPSAAETPRVAKRHSVVVGEDHEIVARRDALRPKRSFGVKALASQAPAGPSVFVRSSGTVVANPRTDGRSPSPSPATSRGLRRRWRRAVWSRPIRASRQRRWRAPSSR